MINLEDPGGIEMAPIATVIAHEQVLSGDEICHEVRFENGQEVRVVAENGEITMTPELPLSALRGFVRGINTDRIRDKKERF